MTSRICLVLFQVSKILHGMGYPPGGEPKKVQVLTESESFTLAKNNSLQE